MTAECKSRDRRDGDGSSESSCGVQQQCRQQTDTDRETDGRCQLAINLATSDKPLGGWRRPACGHLQDLLPVTINPQERHGRTPVVITKEITDDTPTNALLAVEHVTMT